MPVYRDQLYSPRDASLWQLGNRLGLRSERSGWLFALYAVLATTLAATPLWFFVSLQSLVLLYVLAVVVTGLRHGSGPALLVAFLGLSAHNFFFTVPHFDFGLPHQDDISSLAFLSLIALACGPAASRIRHQFLLLHQSNRHLEALRQLGRDLSVAETADDVWEATVRALHQGLQAETHMVIPGEKEALRTWPLLRTGLSGFRDWPRLRTGLEAGQREDVALALASARPRGRFNDCEDDVPWSVFPVLQGDKAIAAALVYFDPERSSLQSLERELIAAMLQQAADTLGRIRLSGELESARVQTEMEQLRSALLSSVSHDLKSPLSAIMGAAESLSVLDKQLPSTDRLELVNMVLQESHRLDSYIQNLLDMTRLENGALKIDRDWVSVNDVIGSAVGRLKHYFLAARIEYHTSTEVPLLYVNPALLEQALFNILENAIKYSPPGEAIHISVGMRDTDTCQITIEDKGPGIPPHLREDVFDMFYVIAEGDHKKPGTGMGLAICRGMIAAHDGRVWAEEGSGGKGTRFVVELPVVYPDGEDKGNKEENS